MSQSSRSKVRARLRHREQVARTLVRSQPVEVEYEGAGTWVGRSCGVVAFTDGEQRAAAAARVGAVRQLLAGHLLFDVDHNRPLGYREPGHAHRTTGDERTEAAQASPVSRCVWVLYAERRRAPTPARRHESTSVRTRTRTGVAVTLHEAHR